MDDKFLDRRDSTAKSGDGNIAIMIHCFAVKKFSCYTGIGDHLEDVFLSMSCNSGSGNFFCLQETQLITPPSQEV